MSIVSERLSSVKVENILGLRKFEKIREKSRKFERVWNKLLNLRVLNEKGIMVTGYEVDVTSTVTISVTTNNVTLWVYI
eukprot:1359017-Amorphochlora_amoeboformis.AAC.1